MSAAPVERVLRFGAHTEAAPRLSVLTPFYRYDPSAMLARLGCVPAGVELVLLDDGSKSATLLSDVLSAAHAAGAPTTVITRAENGGRAQARNRLLAAARGDYVLFLDADMLPDAPDFLARWLSLIETRRPAAAFGGLSLQSVAANAETALHHDMFARSDCRNAAARAQSPAQFTATANLLVRRDVLEAIPFDSAYVGWGFEDVDWALRVARAAEIVHVDNSAAHAGLDSVDTLLRKSRQAGPNFARLAHKHPETVRRFAAHRVARLLRRLPHLSGLRDLFAWIARDPLGATPMRLRCAALKLYRASHYAEHLA